MTSPKPSLLLPLFTALRAVQVRRAVAWLVAGVIGLQALGVGIALGRGPSHTHVVPAATSMVLFDARRGGFEADAATLAEPTSFIGHRHGSAARHFHAANDASVVVSADDQRLEAANDNGHALDLVVAALMAVMTTALLWLLHTAVRQGPAQHTGWQPSTGFRQRVDRPPQST